MFVSKSVTFFTLKSRKIFLILLRQFVAFFYGKSPKSGIPGFGPSQNAQQQQQQASAPGTSSGGPSQAVSGASSGASMKTEPVARQVSTAQMKRDLEQAAVYVPTPIPEGSTQPQQRQQQQSQPQARQMSTQQAANLRKVQQYQMSLDRQREAYFLQQIYMQNAAAAGTPPKQAMQGASREQGNAHQPTAGQIPQSSNQPAQQTHNVPRMPQPLQQVPHPSPVRGSHPAAQQVQNAPQRIPQHVPMPQGVAPHQVIQQVRAPNIGASQMVQQAPSRGHTGAAPASRMAQQPVPLHQGVAPHQAAPQTIQQTPARGRPANAQLAQNAQQRNPQQVPMPQGVAPHHIPPQALGPHGAAPQMTQQAPARGPSGAAQHAQNAHRMTHQQVPLQAPVQGPHRGAPQMAQQPGPHGAAQHPSSGTVAPMHITSLPGNHPLNRTHLLFNRQVVPALDIRNLIAQHRLMVDDFNPPPVHQQPPPQQPPQQQRQKQQRSQPAPARVPPQVPSQVPVTGGVAADEPPPPCSYSPVAQSSESKIEPVDVKPRVAPVPPQVPVTPTKPVITNNKKKRIDVVTLDEDAPRRVQVKQEIPEVSSTSDATKSDAAPTARGAVRIKQEVESDVAPNTILISAKKFERMKAEAEDKEDMKKKIAALQEALFNIQEERRVEKEIAAFATTNQAVPQNQPASSVQIAQVSTSESDAPGTSEAAATETMTSPKTKNNVIVETEGEQEEDEDEIPIKKSKKRRAKIVSNDEEEEPVRHPKRRSDEKREKRHVSYAESDDDMPVVKKKRRNQSPEDPEYSAASPSEDEDDDIGSFVVSDNEDDDADSFVVGDDEPIEYEEEDEDDMIERRSSRKRRDTPTGSRSMRSTSPNDRRKSRETPPGNRSMRRTSPSDGRKSRDTPTASSSMSSSTLSYCKKSKETPMSYEEIEQQKKAKRQRNCKTREENRERKRLAQLEELESSETTGVRRTLRSTQDNSDPLDASLATTIEEFRKTKVRRCGGDNV
nr:hypothetical protein F52C9.8a - Caenorhabditis elegans [Caenorhabditis elegans]